MSVDTSHTTARLSALVIEPAMLLLGPMPAQHCI